MTIDLRDIINECNRLVTIEDWSRVLELTSSREMLKAEPKLMAMRIAAALESGNTPLALEVADIAAEGPYKFRQVAPVFRSLLSRGNAEGAWKILNSPAIEVEEHVFLKQAGRLRKGAPSASIKKEVAARKHDLRRGGTAVAFEATDIKFPGDGTSEPFVYRHPVVIAGSARTNPKHVAGLSAARDSFVVSMKSKSTPEVYAYRNVFVDRYGQIWDETGAIIRAKGYPIPSVDKADVPRVALGFGAMSATRGIYHWLVDRLPHFAWMTNPGAPAATIILSDNTPAFERETLKLAGLGDRDIHLVGDAVFVETLLISKVGMRGIGRRNQIGPILDAIVGQAARIAETENYQAPDYVYVSRRDAKRRSMTNELELEEKLSSRGYTPVLLSKIPLWQQIYTINRAKGIVAPHGAGLSHLIFANPDTKVSEILPIKDGTYALRFNYARLSIVLGLDYRCWLEPQPLGLDTWDTDIDGFLGFFDQAGG